MNITPKGISEIVQVC